MALGTHGVADYRLFSQFGNPDRITVAEVEQELAQVAENVLAVHESRVTQMISDFVEPTTRYQAVYGGDPSVKLYYGDEYNVPKPSRMKPGATVGFPLNKLEGAYQFTKVALKRMPVSHFENLFKGFLIQDALEVKKALARAIFRPTNRTVLDHLVDNKEITVYALLNADGRAIPSSAVNGNSFDGSTHTHYMKNNFATLREDDVRSLITNVVEHGVISGVRGCKLYISSTLVSTFNSFKSTGSFVPAGIAGVVQSVNDVRLADGRTLNTLNTSDRFVGLFDGFDVIVADWVPAGYLLFTDSGAIGTKTLGWRTDETGYGKEFGFVWEEETYVLKNTTLMRMFGAGVWNRHMTAVMQVGVGTTYAEPTIS